MSEVVAGGQGVGVGLAEDLLAVGEGALVQRDGLGQPPGRLVGAGEVVAGGQGVGVGLAEDLLAVGEGALVQRDGLGQPPGRLVGAGEVVAGGQGVGVGLAEDLLAVGEELLAVLDGLGEAVAEFVQAPDRPAAQPQQCFGQRGVVPAQVGGEVLVQGHDLRDGIAGGGPVLPRLGQRPGHRRQQLCDACAEPGQGPVAGLPLGGHPHGQPVRGHRGTIDAEGQQRRAGQPPERLVNACPARRPSRCRAVRAGPAARRRTAAPGTPRPPTTARPR